MGRIKVDGHIVKADGQTLVTKAAIEQVWYLPGIAERFGCSEQKLRQALFRETNMMYPELLTRNDIKLFLPPSEYCHYISRLIILLTFVPRSRRSNYLYVG